MNSAYFNVDELLISTVYFLVVAVASPLLPDTVTGGNQVDTRTGVASAQANIDRHVHDTTSANRIDTNTTLITVQVLFDSIILPLNMLYNLWEPSCLPPIICPKMNLNYLLFIPIT